MALAMLTASNPGRRSRPRGTRGSKGSRRASRGRCARGPRRAPGSSRPRSPAPLSSHSGRCAPRLLLPRVKTPLPRPASELAWLPLVSGEELYRALPVLRWHRLRRPRLPSVAGLRSPRRGECRVISKHVQSVYAATKPKSHREALAIFMPLTLARCTV